MPAHCRYPGLAHDRPSSAQAPIGRARGNNLFGIKADQAWKGAVVEVAMHEVIKGRSIANFDKFRA